MKIIVISIFPQIFGDFPIFSSELAKIHENLEFLKNTFSLKENEAGRGATEAPPKRHRRLGAPLDPNFKISASNPKIPKFERICEISCKSVKISENLRNWRESLLFITLRYFFILLSVFCKFSLLLAVFCKFSLLFISFQYFSLLFLTFANFEYFSLLFKVFATMAWLSMIFLKIQ